MIDYGVFYEFIPLEDVGKENPRICCLEEVELNKNYAMVISTSCRTVALYDWGYREVHQQPPVQIRHYRAHQALSSMPLARSLMVDSAEQGLSKSLRGDGCTDC